MSHYTLRQLTPADLPPSAWLVSKGATISMVIALAVGLHITIERPSRALVRRLFGF